jgi:osmoprotectant transport system substrate-binding protein/osmoprotectant transport system permease protein
MISIKSLKNITVICLAAMIFFAGCGSPSDENSIVIYDGQYSEMRVIHQMVKLLVEEHTDLTVTIKDEMSHVNSYNELVKGNCDLMNSYDGTLLTTFLKLDPNDVPEGQTLYDFVNEVALERDQVRLLAKLGTDNTYAVAVPQQIADQYNLEVVSDLIPVAGELVFGAEHEFFSQEGSGKFNPFVEFYGLEFKEGKAIDMGLKYSAVESGNVDVTVVYATDGLNKKAKLKILEDDREFFPEYNGSLLVRDDLFERFQDVAPNLEEVLNMLGGRFTDEVMTGITYAIDVEGRTPKEMAKEFLQAEGLIE